MSGERETAIARIRVPGAGTVPVALSVRVSARRRSDGREVAVEFPMASKWVFEMPDGAGRGRAAVWTRAEPGRVLACRVECRADIAPEWVLWEVALVCETRARAWTALVPSGWGREIPAAHPDFDCDGNYPGWSCCAQLLVLQGARGGFSMSVRDPALELKHLRLSRRDGLFRMEVARTPEFRDSAWQVGGECDVLLAPHASDWTAAAREYRRQQERVRPELRAPRVPHPLLAGDPFWLTYDCFAYPPHAREDALHAIRELAGPTFVHLYNWPAHSFDTHYPELLEDRPGLEEDLAALRAAGAHCFPYLNGRLWDTTVEAWREAIDKTGVRNPAGRLETEIYAYSSNIDLAVACPSQADYRRRVVESCKSVAARHELWGVYLDQLGAAFGLRCYADGHGHPPGGARSWNAGQRALLREIRAALAHATGGSPFLTTENASEPLVDLLDGFLYYCGRPHETLGRPVPLWQAIYGDFGHGFADNFGKELLDSAGGPTQALLDKLARQAIFGCALGWLSPKLAIGPCAAAGELMRSARAARLPFLRLFRGGVPVAEALDTTGACGVFLSAWKDEQEAVALAVNPRAERASFRWPDGTAAGLEPLQAAVHRLERRKRARQS